MYAQPTLADQFGKLFDSIVAGLGDFLFPQPAEPSDGYTPIGGKPMSEPWRVSPPGQSSDALVSVSVPGLSNNGPQREPNISTPMDGQDGPTLIYQEGGEGKSFSTADVAVAAENLGVKLNEISIDEDGTAHVTIGTANFMSRSDVQALHSICGVYGCEISRSQFGLSC